MESVNHKLIRIDTVLRVASSFAIILIVPWMTWMLTRVLEHDKRLTIVESRAHFNQQLLEQIRDDQRAQNTLVYEQLKDLSAQLVVVRESVAKLTKGQVK